METYPPSRMDFSISAWSEEFSTFLASRIHSIPPSILLDKMEAQSAFQRCLSPQIPIVEGIEIAALNLPASGNGVTGDFYNVKAIEDSSIGIIMGDVSGKGPRALPLATYIQGFTSAQLQKDTNRKTKSSVNEVNTGALLSGLNYVLRRKLNECNITLYATAFCGIIDGRDKTLRYSTGGHPPALLVRQGKTQWLSEGGTIIGLLPQPFYPQERIPLVSGDLIVLYTDGITEASNGDKQFGLKRLSNLVEAHAHTQQELRTPLNPAQLTEQIFQAAIDFHSGPLTDDATVMVLRID